MFYVTAARLQSLSLGEGPINPIVAEQDKTVFGFAPFFVLMGTLYDGLQRVEGSGEGEGGRSG